MSSDVPRRIGLLGGIVAFCITLLSRLLQHSQPLTAMKKAGLSAAILAVMIWLCAYVVLGLVSDGMRRNKTQ
jgi:hypothetical protein